MVGGEADAVAHWRLDDADVGTTWWGSGGSAGAPAACTRNTASTGGAALRSVRLFMVTPMSTVRA